MVHIWLFSFYSGQCFNPRQFLSTREYWCFGQESSNKKAVINTAISPTLWLIPSSLIILKNPIDGYNNKLKVSDKNMVFGINKNLNYYGSKTSETSPVKKQHNIELKKLEKWNDSERSNRTKFSAK